MYEKQSIVGKRQSDDRLRQNKSIEFKKSLDDAEEEEEKRGFMDLYEGILANVFVRRYSDITNDQLQ